MKNSNWGKQLRGHWQTLAPFVSRSTWPLQRPATSPWRLEVKDEQIGHLEISGRFLKRSSTEAVICMHGLGGSIESGYMALLLRAAEAANISCLLLNCRGADRSGSDVYHSGLVSDLQAALQSEELRSMDKIDIFGYSIGGHIALRYACGHVDERLRRVAAIGAPLDLQAAATDFDAARLNIYRSHVMDSLKEIYTKVYQRRPQGVIPHEARKIRSLKQWDSQIIAPRFGYESAEHYYRAESVGPRLAQLKVEALYVGAVFDPMILKGAVDPYLDAPQLTTIWDESAGHLGFSSDFSLGQSGEFGLEHQVLSWLAR